MPQPHSTFIRCIFDILQENFRMPHCAAKFCICRSSAKTRRQIELENKTKITFHQFPKSEVRRLKWANSLGLQLTALPKKAYLCSLHFAENSFDRTSLSCVRLRNDATPCTNNAEADVFEENYSVSHVNHVAECDTINEVSKDSMLEKCDASMLTYHNMPKQCQVFAEICENYELKREKQTSVVYETNQQPTLPTLGISTQTTSDMDLSTSPLPSNHKATTTSPDLTWNTPRKVLLRKVINYQKESSRKQIQALKKQNRRQLKKIAVLESVVKDLLSNQLIDGEQVNPARQ